MKALWWVICGLALLPMATVVRAEEPEVVGLSVRAGPGWLLADFGEGFDTGYLVDIAITAQRGRPGYELFFVFQDNPATSQQNAEASARNGQDTKVSFSDGSAGVRIRYLYPGLDSFVSVYGEAGAGVSMTSFTDEIAGERKDESMVFGFEGSVGAGVSLMVVRYASIALGGQLRQAVTSERPLTSVGATAALTMWFR